MLWRRLATNRGLFDLFLLMVLLISSVIVYNARHLFNLKRGNLYFLSGLYETHPSDKAARLDHVDSIEQHSSHVDYAQTARPHNMSFDEYCDKHGEWIAIKNNVYVKKTAAFLYIDANLVRIHILRRGSLQHEFSFQVKILKRTGLMDSTTGLNKYRIEANFFLNQTAVLHAVSSSKYFYNVLSAQLNLSEYVSRTDLTSRSRMLKVMVLVWDKTRHESADAFVNLKLKQLRSTHNYNQRKGSLVCSKCFYLSKSDDFVTLKWWLELNKRTGHDNVYLCDHAIEKHPDFDLLFKEYAGFIRLDRLKCLPNLQSLEKYVKYKYLKSYRMLEWAETGQYDVTKYEVIMQLIQNECYSNYFDKYKYIAAYDNDEIIISNVAKNFFSLDDIRAYISKIDASFESVAKNEFKIDSRPVLSSVKCNRYEQVDNATTFEQYFGEVGTKFANFQPPRAYFFNQGYFLDLNFTEQIFDKFEASLANFSIGEPYELMFEVRDENRPGKAPHAFYFATKGKEEFHYAVNLLKIWRSVLKPFLKENRNVIAQFTRYFDRLFAIVDELNNFALGKTLHDTRVTIDLSIHFMESYMLAPVNDTPKIVLDRTYSNYHYLGYQYAHLSHFRKHQYFQFKTVPMHALILDLNYLNCFFLPTLAKISRSTLKV
jgi:hypothetical protein